MCFFFFMILFHDPPFAAEKGSVNPRPRHRHAMFIDISRKSSCRCTLDLQLPKGPAANWSRTPLASHSRLPWWHTHAERLETVVLCDQWFSCPGGQWSLTKSANVCRYKYSVYVLHVHRGIYPQHSTTYLVLKALSKGIHIHQSPNFTRVLYIHNSATTTAHGLDGPTFPE